MSKSELEKYNITPNQVAEYVYETRTEVESDTAEDVVIQKSHHHHHHTNRL